MKPAVSVVVATYNYGRFLAGAIDSALGQTFDDLEVVVVDDGSTDATAEVIRAYLGDPRVRYVRTDHVGQPAAKNVGIGLARGRWVAFLDADDLWLPTKLERQMALFGDDPGLGVAYCRRRLIDEEGHELETPRPTLYRGDVLGPIFLANFICFSSAVVAREVFDEVGKFDESLELAIDYDLWLRVARRWRFDYVDEPLVKYRVGHASLSRRAEERLATAGRIMRRFLDDRGGRSALPAALVRRAWAETYQNRAMVARSRSRPAALLDHCRALVHDPTYGPAWKGLASLPLPESWRRALRRGLGRADWTVRARLDPRRLATDTGAVV